MNSAFDLYNQALIESRENFRNKSAFHDIVNSQLESDVLELFWIYYCSIGVGMTQPVEGWIRQAGERCVEMKWLDLGNTLISDAQQEAGHHLLMIADVKTLIARWNQHHPTQLNVSDFLLRPYLDSVNAYRELHENVIASEAPYGQIAIEYEIECLAVQYGSDLIEVSQKMLGSDFNKALSFMQTHVTLDANHSEESKLKLKNFLENNPETLENLAPVGAASLDTYRVFLHDCLSAAQRHHQAILADELSLQTA